MVTLRQYSHCFEIVTGDKRIKDVIYDYYRNNLSTFKFGAKKSSRSIDKTFASANSRRTHFRMHINFLADFKRHMASRGYSDGGWDVQKVPMYQPAKAKFKCIFPHPLRDKQVEIKSFTLFEQPNLPTFNVEAERRSFIIPLQMGGGKTLISLNVAAELGVRTMIIVSKRYMENWMSNIYGDEAKLDVSVDEVLVIRTTNDLIRAIRNYREKNPKTKHKIILCSKNAVTNFISAYLKDEEVTKEYIIKPQDLYETLGIGLLIRDEVHEELHANCKQDLYKHVPMVIELSATLIYDDPKLNALCNVVYNLRDRYNGGEWNKYIDVRALYYQHKNPTKLKWAQYKGGPYNHAEYEKSIIKDPAKLEAYKVFVQTMVVEHFNNIYEPGDKCAIYCSTVRMAEALATHLNEYLPQYKTGKYTSEDDYSELMNNDISVTTPGSAGTGVDISGLRRIFLLIGIKSSQKTYQISGRLRELFVKDRHGKIRDTLFFYFTCVDIDQHRDYDEHKRNLFKNKVRSHGVVHSGFVL